jgi:protoporphyrinogen oxidase
VIRGKVAIIGAGISGISAARMLMAKGVDVVVYERGAKPGGLVRCDFVKEHLFHRTGGHVFNAKNKDVITWFWRHFDRQKEFIETKRHAKIWINGKYVGYPIENYLFQFEPQVVSKIVEEIIILSAAGYRDPYSYPDFSAFLLNNFGRTLYELYFKPYNEKIWRADLSQVALPWLEGKLPMPDYKQIILNNIFHQEESQMVHSTFYYPRQGGSQFIIDRLSEGVTIHTNTEVNRISFHQGQWQLNDLGMFDCIIYTGDVRRLADVIERQPEELKNCLDHVRHLLSNGTSNMLCETDDTDLSWLYLPGAETRAHRIIYTGNFSPANNGAGRKSCVVEFSGEISEKEILKELPKLPGNLKPIAYNYEPNSYVIQHSDTREKIDRLKLQLQRDGFFISGRFAEWEYYNMDKAIEASLRLTEAQTLRV